ncbi:hypothetical protein [Methylobacterium sp. Leaf106]|uniref:hypothetical protein n=1 Tax=Methylobacterium sp. Leaf106 TaxID=1736255 RepID=UPI0006FAE00D|nr:hypothetical protein [Methylobacterium sp. Leaf106]KQP53048.1 hypothetical protein ASF34_01375 [Methylobacterium sp. Leaf106]
MAFAKSPEQVERFRSLAAPRREASGQPQRPTTRKGRSEARKAKEDMTETEALSVALNQPHRRSVKSPRLNQTLGARDPKAGFPIGRLYLAGTITIDQLNASEKYIELYQRYAHQVVGVAPKFPCQAISDAPGGKATSRDMTFEEADKIKAQWHEAQTALADTGEWAACAGALVAIGVMLKDPRNDAELGALRIGLNALHRCWK